MGRLINRHENLENEFQSQVPDILNLPPGRLYFGYPVVPLVKNDEKKEEVFKGTGNTLRK